MFVCYYTGLYQISTRYWLIKQGSNIPFGNGNETNWIQYISILNNFCGRLGVFLHKSIRKGPRGEKNVTLQIMTRSSYLTCRDRDLIKSQQSSNTEVSTLHVNKCELITGVLTLSCRYPMHARPAYVRVFVSVSSLFYFFLILCLSVCQAICVYFPFVATCLPAPHHHHHHPPHPPLSLLSYLQQNDSCLDQRSGYSSQQRMHT